MVQLPSPSLFTIVKKKVKGNPRVKSSIMCSSPGPVVSETQYNNHYNSNTSQAAIKDSPQHFQAGSLIQLATGATKKVEDLSTDDFIESANLCPEVCLEHSMIVRLEHVQSSGLVQVTFSVGKARPHPVTITATPQHPFFVWGRGWASCDPSLTMITYSLNTLRLKVGNVCVSFTRNITNNTESNVN